nr:MAG TPA: hypothetical protein [Caudoviricetes sp.]
MTILLFFGQFTNYQPRKRQRNLARNNRQNNHPIYHLRKTRTRLLRL